MRPMLATPGQGSVPHGPGWVHEVKWDGVRLLADVSGGDVRLSTRSEREVTVGFPELHGLRGVARDALFDGEAVTLVDGRPSFARLVERVHTGTAAHAEQLAAHQPVTYLVFDLLRLDGLDLTPLPWHRRREALEAVLAPHPSWSVTPTYPDGDGLLRATSEQGLEGVVSKRVDAPYRPGARSGAWVKFPHRATTSYVIGGWRPETGRQRLGALLVGTPSPSGLIFRGRVGSGLAGRAGAELAQRLAGLGPAPCPFLDAVPPVDARGTTWVRPDLVVDVASLGTTAADRLRQPAYKRWRADLAPADLVVP